MNNVALATSWNKINIYLNLFQLTFILILFQEKKFLYVLISVLVNYNIPDLCHYLSLYY